MIVSYPLLVFALSFVLLLLAATLGDVLRRRVRVSKEEGRDDFGVVLTGTLTLLGLIIGFSFSMAISRYDLRKNFEQAEANAIAITYMRTDLLPTADAARIRELLKSYLEGRLLFYTVRNPRELAKNVVDTTQRENELWSNVRAAIAAVPPPQQGSVISAVSDIVTSRRSTQAVWSNRIPVAAWVLMLGISIGCNFLIGYRARRTDWLVFMIMPVVVSISLFLIADLDSPRGGTIRVAPQNLMELSQSLRGS